MPKEYSQCPTEVTSRAEALIKKFHPDLKAAEVTIDYIFVSSDAPAPLKLHGVRALAIVRIVSTKDRAKGQSDAEIQIDELAYDAMTPAKRDALLDHELEHLVVKRNQQNEFAIDSNNRPKLKMRPHDVDVGWFETIAQRHKENSVELQQARWMQNNFGETFFPFMQAIADKSETE